MAKRGRKPRSAALKVLAGTRADRASTPPASPGLPECPTHLDREAAAEWARIVPDLAAAGILGRIDAAALALYCDAHSTWVRARAEVKALGLLVETGLGGFKANPAVAIARAAGAQMHRLLVEFGATPSSRSRVQATAEAPRDELADFLDRRKA